MTAEIAILNRSAVALAADSAVTLNISGRRKINNSVDKLFQLSYADPVGIMVFGGAEYMGIPIETIIKEFREKYKDRSYDRIINYSEAFFEFLEKQVAVPEEIIEDHVASVLYSELLAIEGAAQRNWIAILQQGKKFTPKKFAEQLKIERGKQLDSRIKELKRRKTSFVFDDIDAGALLKPYNDLLAKIAKQVFDQAFVQDNEAALQEVGGLVLTKDTYPSGSMGLVVAGFGREELFPTLQAFESGGLIGGRVKRVQTKLVDIDRGGVGAHVEALAQKEMVERFLDGIDPSFDEYIQTSMRETLKKFSDELADQLTADDAKKNLVAKQNITKAIDHYMKAFAERAEKRKVENFRQKILDMVHFMPKSDLAAMAESLVNLTSIKRRVSAEEETVGGPIDVAVISRGDGFVWIKRKHYFEAELNPRYFVAQRLKLEEGRGSR